MVSASDFYEPPLNSLTLLYGTPGSGKSTFCREAAVNRLSRHLGPVIFITTEYLPEEVLRYLARRGVKPEQLESVWLVDAFTVTTRGPSSGQQPRVFAADCTDLASIGAKITEISKAINGTDILLILDSLSSPYLFNGDKIITFLRAALMRFALMGNRVLMSFDEGCGKPEDLVALQSMSSAIMRIEVGKTKRSLNVTKFPNMTPLVVDYRPRKSAGPLPGSPKLTPEDSELRGGERRLAAIMFVDMVGYTSIGQRDESLSLELVEEQRKLIRQILPSHSGREVKTMGDALLLEFSNALEAVTCAMEMQSLLKETNARRSEERRIMLRVGIHLGDVIHTDDDVIGDAVNIASRIQQLAPPGGISVTAPVYESVVNKVECGFESMGTPQLKNVITPIEIFRIRGYGQPVLMPATNRTTMLEDRVAVLPFANISPDPSDEYFADGMTEELISALSRIGGMRVVARTSVMRFKRTKKSLAEIGHELKVGLILEGSIRKSERELRITVQLVDVHTEEHLWSQNYDRELNNAFAVQVDISQKVAEVVKVQVPSAWRRQLGVAPTTNVEAHMLYMKGRFYWSKRTGEFLKRAIECFERAINIDPGYAQPYTGLADCLGIIAYFRLAPARETFEKAKSATSKALKLNDNLAEAHNSLAFIHLYHDWKPSDAVIEYERAIALDPSYSSARSGFAVCLALMGRVEEAVEQTLLAQELDPLSPLTNATAGLVFFLMRQNDRAVEECRKALELDSNFALAHAYLGYVFIQKQLFQDAIRESERAVSLSGGSGAELSILGQAYAAGGKTNEAKKTIDEIRSRFGESHVSLAPIYSALGDTELAIQHLERAYAEHDGAGLVFSKALPAYDEIRQDARFIDLLGKIGLDRN